MMDDLIAEAEDQLESEKQVLASIEPTYRKALYKKIAAEQILLDLILNKKNNFGERPKGEGVRPRSD